MPPETPQGIPESVVFSGFAGLKNTVDRERLGPRDLAVALNVDLDDEGVPHRRRGFTKVASGNFHSLYEVPDGSVYGVKDGSLGIIEPDYFFTDLGYQVGDEQLQYVYLDGKLYFTSPNTSGIVTHQDGVVDDWGPAQSFWYSPVVDPSATLPAIAGKLYGGPPRASALGYYNGRIYLAQGKMLWTTVFQLYTLVDKTRGFIQFEDEITMVGVVADGLYVGTTEGLWFLAGGAFEKLKRTRVMDSPVIPGSLVYIPSELGNPPEIGLDRRQNPSMQVNIAFMTTRGFCVAEDGGKAVNLTEAHFFFPVARRISAFWRRQDGMNQYIACMDADGPPVNGARIGEYVDPAIRRGNTYWVDMADSAKATERYT